MLQISTGFDWLQGSESEISSESRYVWVPPWTEKLKFSLFCFPYLIFIDHKRIPHFISLSNILIFTTVVEREI